MPRSTLQAWHSWHDTLDICPEVAQFFRSGPGLAFLHRLVLVLHLVCVEVGACGIRLVCLLLQLTGLDRFVAASYGAQQQVNRQVEQAIVDYRQAETARLAKDMPSQAGYAWWPPSPSATASSWNNSRRPAIKTSGMNSWHPHWLS